MPIAIAAISIFAITGLALLLNRGLPFRICPICAGVSGTWLWMLAGVFFGLLPASGFLLPAAILMGGSVVGIAYQAEKRLPRGRSPLLWKTLFIPAGFIAVYCAILSLWPAFAALAVLLAALALGFAFAPEKPVAGRRSGQAAAERKKSGEAAPGERSSKVEELENKMKDCC